MTETTDLVAAIVPVDFNRDGSDTNLVVGIEADADRSVHVGDMVLAFDYEGYQGDARVTKIEDGLVWLDLIGRFRTPEEPPLLVSYGDGEDGGVVYQFLMPIGEDDTDMRRPVLEAAACS